MRERLKKRFGGAGKSSHPAKPPAAT
jgi:hypothetical protein